MYELRTMAENFAFIEFQLCLRWTIGQIIALCKKLGKKLETKKSENKNIKKKRVSFFKKTDTFFKVMVFKLTPFKRCRFG
jgi:hypothetical protein